MVSLQVPESNSTLVIIYGYCKQDCTFSDYINYAVGRGRQLLSARPTAAIINKGKVDASLVYFSSSGDNILGI